MTRRTAARVIAALLSVGALDACRKRPAPEPTPAAGTTQEAADRRRADSIFAVAGAQRRADSIASAAAAGGDAQRIQSELLSALGQRIYFDYDRDVLRDDAREILDAKAPILIANPAISLLVTGHTDERGTAEYNLALGQRRAAQVKRYLTSKGVGESLVTTQSVGDAQPASDGTDDASYQQNRRAEFEVRNASGALVRPRS